MPAATIEARLTEEERDLIVQLLDREREDLPVEIRHTHNAEYRGDLHRRLDCINRVLRQLKEGN